MTSTLPTLNAPVYRLKLPSTDKEIKFRPFLVKEEKIFLIALQENKDDAMIDALKQIVDNCTFGQLDVDNLPIFDIEYLFLQLRIKSKGGIVPLTFKCSNLVKDKDGVESECGNLNVVNFNLDHVKLERDPEHKNKIMITDSLGVIMKYPNLGMMKEFNAAINGDTVEAFYNIFPSLIESVFEGDKVYEDQTAEDLKEFIESMTDEQFKKLHQFFSSMPKLRAKFKVRCTKCNHEEEVVLEGLSSFLEF